MIPYPLIAPRLMPRLLRQNLTYGMYACLCAVGNDPGCTIQSLQDTYGLGYGQLRKPLESLIAMGLITVKSPHRQRKGRPQNEFYLNSAGLHKLHNLHKDLIP